MGFARKVLSGRGLLVAGLTAGVLAAGGTAAAFAAGGDDDDTAPRAPRIGYAQAADAALKAVPGGRIESLELDDDGRALWEADVLAGDGVWRDLRVDAGDGRVVSNHVDRPEDGDDGDDRDDRKEHDGASGRPAQARALQSAKVDAVRAAGAASRSAPGVVTSVEFEHRAAQPVWEVDITGQDGRERELHVDAATGKVVADDDSGDDSGDDSRDDSGDDD
ncbi:PepSY domain-containing protein [Actinomadura sp. NPDC047616]|uniref:PepSY domain-containing protein n=1 Tax=Actinomadura sp. NPDC047616 TaxID=3155914 RepID=UPI0033C623DB